MEWITRMLRPPRAVLWSVVVSAAVLLTLCLNGTIAAPAVAYFAYLYSTYALVIFCVWIPSAVRRSRAFAFGRLRAAAGDSRAMRWLVALAEDADFRTLTMLVPSLLFNLASPRSSWRPASRCARRGSSAWASTTRCSPACGTRF